MKPVVIFSILLATVFLSACVGNKRMVYLQNKEHDKPHRDFKPEILDRYKESVLIAAGDELLIEVKSLRLGTSLFESDDLEPQEANINVHPYQRSYLVDDSGFVSIPLTGKIEVAGLSLSEAEDRIDRAIESMLPDAAVKVLFMNHFVSVLGEVNRPTRLYIYDELNILEVIAQVGGLSDYANRSNVRVIRTVDGISQTYILDLTDVKVTNQSGFQVRPGDVIVVSPLARRALAENNFQWIFSATIALVSVASLIISATR